MSYHSVDSNVYHIYRRCTEGDNIESDKFRYGTGGKRLCHNCKLIRAGKQRR